MPFPEPYAGLVIRYSYLWKREQEAGREEGTKDRPCAVVMAIMDQDGEWEVMVLPITHSPPPDPADAIEIPAETKKRLGLDTDRSWIRITEANEFLWPGPDLRPGLSPEVTHRRLLTGRYRRGSLRTCATGFSSAISVKNPRASGAPNSAINRLILRVWVPNSP